MGFILCNRQLRRGASMASSLQMLIGKHLTGCDSVELASEVNRYWHRWQCQLSSVTEAGSYTFTLNAFTSLTTNIDKAVLSVTKLSSKIKFQVTDNETSE
ncbi:hypothetical protein OK016_26185 [Vibrio chagasii]|nr:hypothetical protein [Vibrio chagasii]